MSSRTAVSPELVSLSEPPELLSESEDDESESEDEEESESDELELSCLRLLRGAEALSFVGWSSAITSLGSINFGRNCTYGDHSPFVASLSGITSLDWNEQRDIVPVMRHRRNYNFPLAYFGV